MSPAGCQTGPSTAPSLALAEMQSAVVEESVETGPRVVRIASNILQPGIGTVTIELDALGIENALGFSLMFDPERLSFISAEGRRCRRCHPAG